MGAVARARGNGAQRMLSVNPRLPWPQQAQPQLGARLQPAPALSSSQALMQSSGKGLLVRPMRPCAPGLSSGLSSSVVAPCATLKQTPSLGMQLRPPAPSAPPSARPSFASMTPPTVANKLPRLLGQGTPSATTPFTLRTLTPVLKSSSPSTTLFSGGSICGGKPCAENCALVAGPSALGRGRMQLGDSTRAGGALARVELPLLPSASFGPSRLKPHLPPSAPHGCTPQQPAPMRQQLQHLPPSMMAVAAQPGVQEPFGEELQMLAAHRSSAEPSPASRADAQLERVMREHLPSINKLKQTLFQRQLAFARMTNNLLLEVWDPELEYQLFRLQTAVRQSWTEEEALARIDEGPPVDAEGILKQMAEPLPHGAGIAAVSRVETLGGSQVEFETASPSETSSSSSRAAVHRQRRGGLPRKTFAADLSSAAAAGADASVASNVAADAMDEAD